MDIGAFIVIGSFLAVLGGLYAIYNSSAEVKIVSIVSLVFAWCVMIMYNALKGGDSNG